MICKDNNLSALVRKLSIIYSAAAKKATNKHPPVLKTEQSGWIKGRNEFWKSDNTPTCFQDEYQRSIAEMLARYRLVHDSDPFRFIRDGNPANDFIVALFQTDPLTLITDCGDSVSLMYLQYSGSGT